MSKISKKTDSVEELEEAVVEVVTEDKKNDLQSDSMVAAMMREKDEQIEKLVKDLVDLALTNNQVIAKGNFPFTMLDGVDLAIRMNNQVLRTFTDIENEQEEESK